MKPLTKLERWYAFLEIIFQGSVGDFIPLNHTDYGLLSEVKLGGRRTDELDVYVTGLWEAFNETAE